MGMFLSLPTRGIPTCAPTTCTQTGRSPHVPLSALFHATATQLCSMSCSPAPCLLVGRRLILFYHAMPCYRRTPLSLHGAHLILQQQQLILCCYYYYYYYNHRCILVR